MRELVVHIPYISRFYRHTRDIIDYLRAFQKKEHTSLQVIKVQTPEHLLAAQKLHAKVYVSRGFVNVTYVTDGGILNDQADPYKDSSVYFLVINKKTKEPIATARQIYAAPGKHVDYFPVVHQTAMYVRAQRMLGAQDAQKCVEISGLAKKRGATRIAPLLLYRALWHHSLQNGHSLWLLTCDARLFDRLRLLFGPAIQRMGRTTFYSGGYVVPAVLKVQSSVSELRHSLITAPPVTRQLRIKVVGFLLRGLPVEALSPAETRALNDIKKRYKL